MKKFRFTRKLVKLLKNAEINYIEGRSISFNEPIVLENCNIGEESIIISIFSSTLENKKYFKEIK